MLSPISRVERLLDSPDQSIAGLHHLLELQKQPVAVVDQRLGHFLSAWAGFQLSVKPNQMFLNGFQGLEKKIVQLRSIFE